MSANASRFPRRRRGRFTVRPSFRALAFAAICLILVVKVLGYVLPDGASVQGVESVYTSADARVQSYLRDATFLHSCGAAQKQLVVSGGFVCAAGRPNHSAYNTIFETYPAGPDGKNYVYTSTAAGTMSVANALLRGVIDMPRYAPVHVGVDPTWHEDPYHAVYWRLNYYALRPTQSLLSAYIQTGDTRYADRLIALDKGFFAHDASPSALAWKDDHAVAFRAMILVNQWWRLRQYHQLSEADSTLYLRELERTGQFLADPNHYQPEYNHGTNEAAALFDLALNFPTLPHAHEWLTLAQTRLSQSMDDLVDGDGALIENSPYYHFYTLDKYWQILGFADRFHFVISPNFRSRLQQMINYGTYILQPNDSVPLLGASLYSIVHPHGSFAQMAKANPSFEYALTQGEKGTKPAHTSVFLPHTGQTIMRSGWGKGSSYAKQSFLTFNVGSYRTPHSHLDILGITLFGNGAQLLADAGLYTYAPGKMFNYFHGTTAHNTVVVDGQDQAQGSAEPGRFVQQDGVTYQTGSSLLYAGVTHRRMVMMIDRTHFLVVDRLSSAKEHRYSQMFHFAAGVAVSRDGLTITGTRKSGATISIRQLDPRGLSASVAEGQKKPLLGWCSLQYLKAVPCPAISYDHEGRDASYATLLTIGPADPKFSLSYDPTGTGRMTIHDHGRTLALQLGETTAIHSVARATDPTPPRPAGVEPLPNSQLGSAGSGWKTGTGANPELVHSQGQLAMRITAGRLGQTVLEDDRSRIDLSAKNLQVKMRVEHPEALGELELEFSNDHWNTTMTDNLEDAYPDRYAGEWLNVSLGRATPRRTGNRWTYEGSTPFDWSRVDGVRIVAETETGARHVPTLEVAGVSSMPEQKQAAVVFVFDDGYSSILPAADYLHRKGMKGDVAVIGKYVELPTQGHLTLHDLRHLQNDWGWNMANHTQSHEDAIADYWPKRRLGAYEQDILSGAEFLEKAGLNSAPNWLIYPHGTTNAGLEKVVGRFYKFARTVDYEPEAYPFGDPLRVKTLEVGIAADDEGGGGSFTTPQQVMTAVHDAQASHSTLILTFHRMHAIASDRPGYPIGPFRKIVDGIKDSGVKVTTLSGLDAMNGVPEDNRIVVKPGKASQISVQLHGHSGGGGLTGWLGGLL